jgi:PAS domain S-box-containing protein
MTTPEAAGESETALRVLMIDDDHDDFLLVDRMLRRSGGSYELEWVGDASTGADRIRRQEHDLYLVDQRLGSDEGLDLIFDARRSGCHRPMILLTGHEAPKFDEYSMEQGAADYLSKNRIDPDAVHRSIRHALARWRLEDRMSTLEHRFRRVWEASPIGMMLADDSRSVVDVNDALAEILHRPRSSLVGMSLDELFDRYADELREIVESAADSMRFSADVETADGIARQVDLLIAALDQRSDHVSHLVQVVDLTELREARRQLEDLLSAKDEFLAAVSHELRTPLTAVLGFAAVLVGQETELSPSEQDELLRSVHRHSIDLANIVEDLLVAARVESQQVRVVPQSVELGGQVQELIDAIVLGGNSVPEFHPVRVTAHADPLRLRQIVRNLLANAVRFGGPEVVVELGSDGDTVSLLVKDNGSGPPPEVAERIFDPYVRTVDAVTTPRSIGLGLAVARHLAQLMDGDLQYARKNGWTEFELRLPTAGGPPE